MWKLAILLFQALSLVACVSQPKQEEITAAMTPSADEQRLDQLWFKGTVEEAFQSASRQNKPIFLYWGAVWCPPCNQLKAEVFTKARFHELMRAFVPVYLDGDTEAAQAWGERLKVSGYPTTLVLNSKGQELSRITETAAIDEFEAAILAAVSSDRDLSATIKLLETDKASPAAWRLFSLISTDALKALGLSPKQQLSLFHDLSERVPKGLSLERAALAARLLELAATTDDSDALPLREAIKLDHERYLSRIFSDRDSERAARATLVYMCREIVDWLYPDRSGPNFQATERRWLAAAEQIALDQSLSLDVRLWAVHPYVVFHTAANAPVSHKTLSLVQEAVKQADAEARSNYQRHAVISGAVDLLVAVADFDTARKLLDKELKVTDTPWYYQSSYANLEKAAGRADQAMAWAKKARLSVKGRASRLQWIVANAVLAAKLKVQDDDYVAEVLRDYYETAFGLSDGFSGRNAIRAKALAQSLNNIDTRPKIANVLKSFAAKCQAGESLDHTKCVAHFASFHLI